MIRQNAEVLNETLHIPLNHHNYNIRSLTAELLSYQFFLVSACKGRTEQFAEASTYASNGPILESRTGEEAELQHNTQTQTLSSGGWRI